MGTGSTLPFRNKETLWKAVFFTQRVVRNRLPREAVDAPSLEVLKAEFYGPGAALPMAGGCGWVGFKVSSNPSLSVTLICSVMAAKGGRKAEVLKGHCDDQTGAAGAVVRHA